MFKKWVQGFMAGLFVCNGLALQGTDKPLTDNAPMATGYAVPVALGSVDAIRGGLNLKLPIGPRLPGRLPVGFDWTYSSQGRGQLGDVDEQFQPTRGAGGELLPVVWCGTRFTSRLTAESLTATVIVHGEKWTFQSSPSVAFSDSTNIQQWMADRKVDNGSSQIDALRAQATSKGWYSLGANTFNVVKVLASTDGTRYYVLTNWSFTYSYTVGGQSKTATAVAGARHMVFYGSSALWLDVEQRITHFTNRWNDSVSITSGRAGVGIGAGEFVLIKNDQSPTEWVKLTMTAKTVVVGQLSQIDITNGMNLPVVTMMGYSTTGTPAASDLSEPFLPTTVTVQANGEQKVTTITWDSDASGPLGRINAILYPNGLRESFTYKTQQDVSGALWTSGLPNVVLQDTTAIKNWPSVDSVTFEDTVDVTVPGSQVKIFRTRPNFTGTAWTGSANTTTVLTFPSSNPQGNAPYRGVQLTHPSVNNWGTGKDAAAYLFLTQVILKHEAIHGAGGTGGTAPSNPTVDTTVLFDGWDLGCWINPSGTLGVFWMDNLTPYPVSAVAHRTRTFDPLRGVRTVIVARPDVGGAKDAYGPVRTDEWVDAPSTLPTVDGSTAPVFSSALSAPAAPIHRVGTVSRQWDGTRLQFNLNSEQKTLDGTGLSALRQGTGGTVDFGTTTNAYDPTTGLISTVTGVRGTYTAVESRTYKAGTPLVQSTSKSLTGPTGAIPVNPAQPSLVAGMDFQYDDTPYHWLTGERDKVDGRWTILMPDPTSGRLNSKTDVNGVTTLYRYDSWGRVFETERQAIGTPGSAGYVGSVVVRTEMDPNGRSKKETTSADGITLITTTSFDAFGRVIKVTAPDGSTQTTNYDGWGQKLSQSPRLKPGQSFYGNYTWSYNAKGRVIAAKDPQGRYLSSAFDQTVGPTDEKEPQWVPTEQGIVVKTWDAANHMRQEITDLLGQKKAVIDQKLQRASYLYDKDGHLQQTQQGAQIRTYTYNDMGWMTSRVEQEEGTTTYDGFTIGGTPTVTIQKGRNGLGSWTTQTILNDWLAPASITATGPEGTVTRTLSYDLTTHRLTGLQEVQPNGAVAEVYGYDALGRITSKIITDGTSAMNAQSFTVSRTLDDSGRVRTLTYPAAGGHATQTVTVTYDLFGRAKQVDQGAENRAKFDYGDAPNQTSAVTTVLTYGNLATTTTKTDLGEVVRVTHAAPSGVLEDNALIWSADGLLKQRGNDTFDYDELQRLVTATVKGLNPSESISQTFTYDQYGNRTGNAFTYVAGTGGTKPPEVLAWTAVYDDTAPTRNGRTNSLPTTVLTPGGSVATGAQYDNLGRLTQVWAIPGDSNSQTTWGYDPNGRVLSESVNGKLTRFLLDGEGLRFKRYTDDASTLQYTIYGFSREPLMVLQKAVQGQGAMMMSAPSSKSQSKALAQTLSSPDPDIDASAQVTQPATDITVGLSQPVLFKGNAVGVTRVWTFGDGATANWSSLGVNHGYGAAGTYTATLTATGSSGATASDFRTITVLPTPGIANFSVSPAAVNIGSSSTLSWAVYGANTVSISGMGTVAASGSVAVSPSTTTTYTLTATNGAGSRTATTTLTVNQKPIIAGFTASPARIVLGTSSTLAWQVTGATSLTISAGVGTVTGLTSKTVNPTTTTTYTLTATNAVGSTTATLTLIVDSAVPVISMFQATPNTVGQGVPTTLSWTVSNQATLTISNGIGNVGGNYLVVTPGSTVTLTLTATNAKGSVTKTATITVASTTLAWTKSMIYGFGQLISEERPSGPVYVLGDQVASPNYLTDATGAVVGRSKNLPFGERFGSTGLTSSRRYTNHEDQEGSPIYMQARMYLSSYGKFAQPDPAYDQTKLDPESWNLFTYVTNNPITKTDPDGRWYLQLVASVKWKLPSFVANIEGGMTDTGNGGWSTTGNLTGFAPAPTSEGPSGDSNASDTITVAASGDEPVEQEKEAPSADTRDQILDKEVKHITDKSDPRALELRQEVLPSVIGELFKRQAQLESEQDYKQTGKGPETLGYAKDGHYVQVSTGTGSTASAPPGSIPQYTPVLHAHPSTKSGVNGANMWASSTRDNALQKSNIGDTVTARNLGVANWVASREIGDQNRSIYRVTAFDPQTNASYLIYQGFRPPSGSSW